ncbi:MAG: hypothetical protein RR279_04760 [Alistipes sp.]
MTHTISRGGIEPNQNIPQINSMTIERMCPLCSCRLQPGEGYVFAEKTETGSTVGSLLWGIFDKEDRGQVSLELVSQDFVRFCTYTVLPAEYEYVRLMTRGELRDFCYNQGWYEAQCPSM